VCEVVGNTSEFDHGVMGNNISLCRSASPAFSAAVASGTTLVAMLALTYCLQARAWNSSSIDSTLATIGF